jgi:hypothetical protein
MRKWVVKNLECCRILLNVSGWLEMNFAISELYGVISAKSENPGPRRQRLPWTHALTVGQAQSAMVSTKLFLPLRSS